MEKKETAEQKLLKIIENPKRETAVRLNPTEDVASKIAQAVKGSGFPSVSILSYLAPITGLLRGRFFASFPEMSFGPREINRILLGIVILTVLLFVVNIFSGIRILNKEISFNIETKMAGSENGFVTETKTVDEYLDSIRKRNIFQPYEKKEAEIKENILVESNHIAGLIKNFKLVGISWLDSPASASAMIEDTQTGITQFLKEGEAINGVKVRAIYVDRIILSYEGEEITLKL